MQKPRHPKQERQPAPQPPAQPRIKYLGIVQKYITALGSDNGIAFPFGEDADITYTSGSIKNYDSASVTVRMVSSSFDGGFADIQIDAGDTVVFKRLLLQAIFAPSAPYNSGVSPVIIVVATPFIAPEISLSGPEISLS